MSELFWVHQNLLINSDGTLRLADFGCAIQIDRVNNTEGLVSETVGTTAFWAPECIHTGGWFPSSVLRPSL